MMLPIKLVAEPICTFYFQCFNLYPVLLGSAIFEKFGDFRKNRFC